MLTMFCVSMLTMFCVSVDWLLVMLFIFIVI